MPFGEGFLPIFTLYYRSVGYNVGIYFLIGVLPHCGPHSRGVPLALSFAYLDKFRKIACAPLTVLVALRVTSDGILSKRVSQGTLLIRSEHA